MKDEYSKFPAGTKVLVTGASGFTGQVLVRRLVELGCSVRCIARSSSKVGELEGLPIQWFRGDVFDENIVRESTQGIDYIFHVAAAYREPKITDEVYSKVHVLSTQNLAAAACTQPGFKRFVHVSTVGVHGHIDEPPANETYRFNPGDVYQRTKAEAELWITEFSRDRGLPLTIIRPAAIYGPGDRRLLKIFKLAIKPVFPLFGSGAGLYHLVHVRDLTEILIRAALHPAALGQAFIAGNSKPDRLKDIVATIARSLGRPPPWFIHFPSWPLFLAADLCELVCKPLGISPPLYRRRAAFFTKDRAFDTTKLSTLLGYRQETETESGLSETARWYRQNGWL